MTLDARKVRNGYIIDNCQKCGEKCALSKFDKIYVCNLCKATLVSNQRAPAQVAEIEKQQSRFKQMTQV
jgi:ribosomal protein L37AE/L43A